MKETSMSKHVGEKLVGSEVARVKIVQGQKEGCLRHHALNDEDNSINNEQCANEWSKIAKHEKFFIN